MPSHTPQRAQVTSLFWSNVRARLLEILPSSHLDGALLKISLELRFRPALPSSPATVCR